MSGPRKINVLALGAIVAIFLFLIFCVLPKLHP